jgi:hypothetical protein
MLVQCVQCVRRNHREHMHAAYARARPAAAALHARVAWAEADG